MNICIETIESVVLVGACEILVENSRIVCLKGVTFRKELDCRILALCRAGARVDFWNELSFNPFQTPQVLFHKTSQPYTSSLK